MTKLPLFTATIRANLDSVGQACVDVTFPVIASRKTALSCRGKSGSDWPRFDRGLGLLSRITKVATSVLSSWNHKDFIGWSVSCPRPTTRPSGVLPRTERKFALHLAAISPPLFPGSVVGLLRKCVNKKSATDEINKSVLPETSREKCTKCKLARPRTDGVVVNPDAPIEIFDMNPVVVPSGCGARRNTLEIAVPANKIAIRRVNHGVRKKASQVSAQSFVLAVCLPQELVWIQKVAARVAVEVIT